MFVIEKRKLLKTDRERKGKYSCRRLMKLHKSIVTEFNLQEKYSRTLELALEILIDIYILKLFDQKKSVKFIKSIDQAKLLVGIVLRWSFRESEIPEILEFLSKSLPICQFLMYQDSRNTEKKTCKKRLKVFTGIVISGLAGLIIYYNSFFPKLKNEKDFCLNYVPTAVEIMVPKQSLLVLNSQPQNSDLGAKVIIGTASFPKQVSPNIFLSSLDDSYSNINANNANKNPKNIPLAARTCTLDKLQMKTQEKEKLRLKKIKKTFRFEYKIGEKALQDTVSISSYIPQSPKHGHLIDHLRLPIIRLKDSNLSNPDKTKEEALRWIPLSKRTCTLEQLQKKDDQEKAESQVMIVKVVRTNEFFRFKQLNRKLDKASWSKLKIFSNKSRNFYVYKNRNISIIQKSFFEM